MQVKQVTPPGIAKHCSPVQLTLGTEPEQLAVQVTVIDGNGDEDKALAGETETTKETIPAKIQKIRVRVIATPLREDQVFPSGPPNSSGAGQLTYSIEYWTQ
jgi:hypothetical protein